MVSRWMPVMREVARIEQPSTSAEATRTRDSKGSWFIAGSHDPRRPCYAQAVVRPYATRVVWGCGPARGWRRERGFSFGGPWLYRLGIYLLPIVVSIPFEG